MLDCGQSERTLRDIPTSESRLLSEHPKPLSINHNERLGFRASAGLFHLNNRIYTLKLPDGSASTDPILPLYRHLGRG